MKGKTMTPHPGIIISIAIIIFLTLFNADKRWTPMAGIIAFVVGGLVVVGDLPIWACPVAAIAFLLVFVCEHIWGEKY
ncbi:MAG: hypothetical protein C0507_01540 [Cyanobacteria bacterium PR.3.49]|nr:hypothetical protein [Cyanobacteria bacterium PR.3.49]